MDVRCEKCQTEYELDEARLKPSGVTVKCTQCGHMFKIRKRANTNVGAPPPGDLPRTRPSSSKQNRVEAAIGDDGRSPSASDTDATAVDRERNWLLRLESGEQKSCRELAVLQQWIVAGVVTRDTLISRSGKTWKRLGDIGELAQYFTVADDARRERSPTPNDDPPTKQIDLRSTMMGTGGLGKASSAGGTILPDDDDFSATGSFRAPKSMPPPPGARTPPMGVVAKSAASKPTPNPSTKAPPIPTTPAPKPKPSINETLKPPSMNPTLAAMPPPPQLLATPAAPTVRGRTTPPPTPRSTAAPPSRADVAMAETQVAPPQLPRATAEASMTGLPVLSGPMPAGNRATAAWATNQIRPDEHDGDAGPSGPIGGRIGGITKEPAFAGRVRAEPPDSSVFAGNQVNSVFDDDDDVLPPRRGSKAGLIIAIGSLFVIAGAVAVVYLYVLKDGQGAAKSGGRDAAVAAVAADAAPVVTSLVDGGPAPPSDPLVAARGELAGDVEPRLHTALEGLAGKDDPTSQAVRARLDLALAQALADRANLVTDKAEAEKLRRDSHELVIDALPLAQHAVKGDAASADANLAMAEVMRLEGKPANEVKRFTDKARAALPRDAALVDALVLARDHKLDDARAALTAIDQGDGRMEASGDVRARFHLALLAFAQSKPSDARPLVDQILAARPEHVGARALAARLDTAVASSDPLPPEEHRDAGVARPVAAADARVAKTTPTTNPPPSNSDGNYDALMTAADKAAEGNCSKAMELYQKALDLKPSSVEALTGQAYCHLDAKQFSQAYTKFHLALLYSGHYEPALAGIAEMYQQQGNKEKAIEAWQTYLAAFPGAAKAVRSLEILGVAAGGGGSAAAPQPPAGGNTVPAPTPAPTPAPAPGPTTAPEAGSGT